MNSYAEIRELAYRGKKEEILANFSPREIKDAYKLVGVNWNLNYRAYTPMWCYVIRDCAWEVMEVKGVKG